MTTEEENTIDALVGERVRDRRVDLGLSQSQLAQAIGVTFQQVQKYERGRNRISASKLWLISRFLGVTPASFLSDLPVEAVQTSPEADQAARERADLLAAFGRISDPQRRRTLIDVAEGLGGTRSRPRVGDR